MEKISRVLIILYSFILAVVALVFAALFISNDFYYALVARGSDLMQDPRSTALAAGIAFLIFIFAVGSMVTAIMSGSLRKARVRETGIGTIDISVDAIESLAMNAAKAAQAGVKNCKAGVLPAKGEKITISLTVMTYSDVELPALMQKVQERVQKDIERYTGIEVAAVKVKVTKVEEISAGVEH